MVERQIEIFEERKSSNNNNAQVSLPGNIIMATQAQDESVSAVSSSTNHLEKILRRLFSHSKQ